MSFERILESVLRQDPDTINIGEIRSKDTGEIGIMAAQTGHGVFATLHIRSTAGAPGRMIGLGVNRTNLADTLNTVLSQRLIRKLCSNCKIEVVVDEPWLAEAGWPLDPEAEEAGPSASSPGNPPTVVYRANIAGCEACRGGYFGRFAVPEIMVVTNEVREHIDAGALAQDIHKAAIAGGMVPLRTRALQHVALGDTDINEVDKHIDRAR